MAQVTVQIDGKAYRMACEEGQESHLEDLAAGFDRYVGHLKAQFGEIGDLRITVMAGIMVMDELNDVTRRLETLEKETEQLRSGREGVLVEVSRSEEAIAQALGELTNQIQGMAAKLNGKPQVN
ncbi:cell division protein ZapA [Shinella sumterensis]|jgi:cell division protein ZapA|uniref:Cell division protein ZapA n=1 Tax=Shinella sumterensis TaxID=1967501 RepID=A0AA50H8A8_9HYPH|nr:cell division protein ZapA [Shinella sumterensis]MCD1263072.1 cell division protein ZapA [Shinella sumterensis]TFF00158.1 cell division protein ZapA [Shinella sumterensis]WLR97699.1 cell division protein ZapA [Shinella sumterensis]